MKHYRVGTIIGSLRAKSLNRKLAEGLAMMAPDELSFENIDISALPLFNQDDEKKPDKAVTEFKQAVLNKHAIMFVTPEYNRSIPGVLKNAIDHGSRPFGESIWDKKPAAVIGISAGAIGTAIAQQQLKSILSHLNMPTMCQPEAYIHNYQGLFHKDGRIDIATAEFLEYWLNSVTAWIDHHLPN